MKWFDCRPHIPCEADPSGPQFFAARPHSFVYPQMMTTAEVRGRLSSNSLVDRQSQTRLSKKLVILVVDDDPDMRMYIRGCLRQVKPIQILEAHNGRQALSITREAQPDLIISDSVMPELDGEGLCREIRSDVNLARTPILLISGRTRVVSDLADGFLGKPFNSHTLMTEISRLLDRPA